MFVRMGNDWEQLFGARVKDLRQAQGWSQEELARRMTVAGYSMHQTTIAKLEGGSRPTNVAEVAALAAIFNMPIEALFDDSEAAHLALEAASLSHRLAAIADESAALLKRMDEMRAQREALQADVEDFNRKLAKSVEAAKAGELPKQYLDIIEASVRKFRDAGSEARAQKRAKERQHGE